ncbi:ceramide kinase [Aplysia californica]|uniref:Ceramide kinase n=1 Tax=Aplysia californica TaxID=6500 RepID=A0ABM1VRE2_APLCA|nr:ceramide kinase [Aplysia californica]XP_035824984.1 ceramide kinase [Aplysia californica]
MAAVINDEVVAHTEGADEAKGDAAQDNEAEHVLLEGKVSMSKKDYVLQLTTSSLSLKADVDPGSSNKGSKSKDLTLPWTEILRAEPDQKSPAETRHHSLCLHYIHHHSEKTLRVKVANIVSKDYHAEEWINVIQKQCEKVPGRPKKVFILVNPIGGSKRGRQTCHKVVGPLFELAHVHTTVEVTERSKHALEIAENHDFSQYDGIVVVGGDGLYQEVLQGLIKQTQKRTGVNLDDPDAQLQPPDIPIGIVPAGTGNGVSGWCNGTIDVETSVLNIIRGERHKAMMYTIYSGSKFLCVCGLVFGYGMFGDMIQRTDELRWMGRARYAYCLFGSVVKKKRRFNCEIEVLQAEGGSSKDSDGKNASQKEELKWTKYDGTNKEFCGLSFFVVDKIDLGDRYVANYFGEQSMLSVDTGASNVGMLRTVFAVHSGKKNFPTVSNLDNFERVRGFKIKLTGQREETGDGASSSLAREKMLEQIVDIDGEALHFDGNDLEGRLHAHFLPVFGVYPAKVACPPQ